MMDMGSFGDFFNAIQALLDFIFINQGVSDPVFDKPSAHGRNRPVKHLDQGSFFIQCLYIGKDLKIFTGSVIDHQKIFQVIGYNLENMQGFLHLGVLDIGEDGTCSRNGRSHMLDAKSFKTSGFKFV